LKARHTTCFYGEKLERELRDFFETGRIYLQDEKGLQFLEFILKYIHKITDIRAVNEVSSAVMFRKQVAWAYAKEARPCPSA